MVELLTDEVEGLKFKITNGVDVAEDGTVYFTDVSYKYNEGDSLLEILEGKARGRLMSYDPSTNHTSLLASNLHTPNGVCVSQDQQSVVFCETIARRCRKYHIKGPKKGNVEKFVEDMPGYPDNIHYDGEGHYWIALVSSASYSLELTLRCPIIRKAMAMIVKYVGKPNMERNNAGVVSVDWEGRLKAHYHDSQLSMISSAIKIGNHLYCGSVHYPFIARLDLNKYPAQPTM